MLTSFLWSWLKLLAAFSDKYNTLLFYVYNKVLLVLLSNGDNGFPRIVQHIV